MRSRGKAVAVLYVMMSSALSHCRRYVFLPGKHRVGGREQVGGDCAFDHKPVCPCLQDRTAQDRLVMDADDDQLHLRKTAAQPAHQLKPVSARQGEIDHRKIIIQAAGALEQGSLVGDHHHRLECRCKKAPHALAQTVMRVCQQHAICFAHGLHCICEREVARCATSNGHVDILRVQCDLVKLRGVDMKNY